MKKNLICALLTCLSVVYLLSAGQALAVKVDYQLPYPGILPDNPAYFFKTVRNNVTEFFIGDPVKKAEFDIGRADAYIAAASSLAEQKKNIETIEYALDKAQDYSDSALKNTAEAKMQGMYVTAVVKRLILSNRKHKEVIDELEKKIGKNEKLKTVKNKIEILGRKAKKISP